MADQASLDGKGHRDRLRQRLFEGGPDALLDHELVEYILGLAIPRRDTKPLAKKLLAEFGGIGPLLTADAKTLVRVGGLSETAAAALLIASATANRLVETRVKARPVLSSSAALRDYLSVDMAHLPIERVRILYLDAKNRLLANEALSEGSVDESAVYIREVMRRAIDLHAVALIVVHNHPSGDPTPSPQDISLTRALAEAASHLRITLHDHLIVGAGRQSSLREMGLI